MRASVVFPHPDSPASASTSPWRSCEVDAVDGARRRGLLAREAGADPDASLEGDVEVPDLEDRLCRRSRRGLRTSLTSRPSPPSGRAGTRPAVPRRPRRGSGIMVGHSSNASGQRGWNAHPAGTLSGWGGSPPEAGGRPAEPRVADRRERGRERTRVRVGGLLEHRDRRPLLDDPARVHDREAVAHLDEHRQVVGDEQHREAELAPGGPSAAGAPGPAPSRPGPSSARPRSRASGCRRAPSRSSRAASGRPTARAGSRAVAGEADRPARGGRPRGRAPRARRPVRGSRSPRRAGRRSAARG